MNNLKNFKSNLLKIDRKSYKNIGMYNSDDDLPLNKPLKFHMTTIIIRSVFEEDGKLYPRVFFR